MASIIISYNLYLQQQLFLTIVNDGRDAADAADAGRRTADSLVRLACRLRCVVVVLVPEFEQPRSAWNCG